MENYIITNNLSFSYRSEEKPVLSKLELQIPCGAIAAILGESGIGKSTLLRLLSGVYSKEDHFVGKFEGTILIDGHEPSALRGPKNISVMSQNPALLEHLNIAANISLPCEIAGIEKSQDRCNCLLKSLDLCKKALSRPRELSGGERTRTALARAIITKSRYLFLDEPFSSLDFIKRWKMYGILRKERNPTDMTTILSTHDIWEAIILANRIYFLQSADGESKVTCLDNTPPEIDKILPHQCIKQIQSQVEEVVETMERIST